MGTRTRLVSFVVALVVALAWAANARADESASCVPHTERTPEEILVRLGDAPDSPVGISIVAGETLCLAGRVTRGVLAPKLADAEHGEAPLVVLHLDASDAGTSLLVRSTSDREMVFDASVVTGPANLALPAASGIHVPPRGTDVQSLGSGTTRVLLHDVLFLGPPKPVPLDERWLEVSFEGLVGARRLSSVAAFDGPLRASGYGALPRTFVGGGANLAFSLARWRFELPFYYGVASAPSPVDSSSVGADFLDVRVDAGYEFLRWQGLTAFALGGFGMSALQIDTRDPHWTYVADRTGVSNDVKTVEQDSFILAAQLGLEQIVPLGQSWGLMLSLRGGYEQQVADLGWFSSGSDSKSISGLPSLDLSGGWVALGIGLTAYGPTYVQPSPQK